ncbi:bifunctional metallophosphatase/5'-nucleotidase [Xylanibacter caecicola]|uniref:bifunctional metallophosphatase/5'-nucleotidase n=1 Tax=Xylanibacter caecicola TaxID=2736294 RepID=UPI00259CA2CF|nr:bifunctional metallophosphatase/5'-nucleotidase [Xylanibacter caecicola]
MKRLIAFTAFIICINLSSMADTKTVKLRVLGTSDVHGCFFPYNFIERKETKGSLARLSTYAGMMRKEYGDNLIMLDNGDILQGQPTCYYFNYVKNDVTNVAAEVINYLGYDAQTIGNHDVETGHAVYDKWINEVKCPVLGANIVRTDNGKPYLRPYKMICKDGIKIAVLGLLTPAIPNWLTEDLWQGMRFEEMTASARHWMEYIKKNENPDVVIGLFHSGKEGGITTETYYEDATLKVAREVAGVDLIIFGHDHSRYCGQITNTEGKQVLCLNPANNALAVADAEITLTLDNGRVKEKTVTGRITDIAACNADKEYMERFRSVTEDINSYVGKKIGTFAKGIYTRDSFFGSSAFVDLIHNLQLQITGADISFNAPLSVDAGIEAGDIYVSDMFNLYKYENQLYVMTLTGEEVRKHLEMSYDLWVNTMKSADDHILLLDTAALTGGRHSMFRNMTFNFDSAAGIDYEVDVTRPDGEKVHILRMSDGKPFDKAAMYRVVMNSYRGNGGGELLTKGAGIPHDELKNRIIYKSERDLRHYLMQEIEKKGTINPGANNNWRFVPEEWTTEAIKRDHRLLFGDK